jgi:hypothetical protein
MTSSRVITSLVTCSSALASCSASSSIRSRSRSASARQAVPAPGQNQRRGQAGELASRNAALRRERDHLTSQLEAALLRSPRTSLPAVRGSMLIGSGAPIRSLCAPRSTGSACYACDLPVMSASHDEVVSGVTMGALLCMLLVCHRA